MGNRPDTRITGSKRRKALLHSLYPGGLSGNPMKQSPPQRMIMRVPKLTISGNPMKQSPAPQRMIMRAPKLTISCNPMKQSPAPQPLPRRAFRQPNETKTSTTHDNEGAQTDHFRQPNETKSCSTAFTPDGFQATQ